VYIYLYNSTDWGDGTIDNSPHVTLKSSYSETDQNGNFGRSVAVGNFYAGANDDIIVGEPGVNLQGGYSPDGRINMFDGESISNGTGTLNYDNYRDSPYRTDHTGDAEQFGWSVAAGDFNPSSTTNDFDDIIAGAINNPNDGVSSAAGRAYIVEADDSAAGGFLDNSAPTTDIPNPDGSAPIGDQFGWSVWAGDFYNDGVDDFMVGAHSNNTARGMVALYDCDGSSIPTTPTEIINGTQNGEEMGRCIAGGKYGNDPNYLLVLGAPYYDNASYSNNGRVWVVVIPEFSDLGAPAVFAIFIGIAVIRRKRKLMG